MHLLQNFVVASCFVTAMAGPVIQTDKFIKQSQDEGGHQGQQGQQNNQQGRQQVQQSQLTRNQAGRPDIAGIGSNIVSHGLAAVAGASLTAWVLSFRRQAAANPDGTGNQAHRGTVRHYTNQQLAERASDADILTCVADCVSVSFGLSFAR